MEETRSEKIPLSQIFFGFHVPDDLKHLQEYDYFKDYILRSNMMYLTSDQKNEIFRNMIISCISQSIFKMKIMETFQHLIFPSPRFTPRPYMFSHEYPVGGAHLAKVIEFDMTYSYQTHSVRLILNDYIGGYTAMFDCKNGVVFMKSNKTGHKMINRHFSNDPLIQYESPEWYELPIREDFNGFRGFRREVLSMSIKRPLPRVELKRLCPSFRTSSGNGFTETALHNLLCEMEYLNEILYESKMERSIEKEIEFFQRYLELHWFISNYINFNISFHYSMWREL